MRTRTGAMPGRTSLAPAAATPGMMGTTAGCGALAWAWPAAAAGGAPVEERNVGQGSMWVPFPVPFP